LKYSSQNFRPNYATLNVLKVILRNNIAPCPITGTEKETVRVKSARREYLKTIREVIASPQKNKKPIPKMFVAWASTFLVIARWPDQQGGWAFLARMADTIFINYFILRKAGLPALSSM
jgi:hypothetical protein